MGTWHKFITKPQHQLYFNQFSSNLPQIKHHKIIFLYTFMQWPSQQWHKHGRWGSDPTRCLITAASQLWAQRMLSHKQPKHSHCPSISPLSTGVWYKQPTPTVTQGSQPQTRPHECFAKAALSLKARLQPCTKEGRGHVALVGLLSAFAAGLKITISLWSMFF